MQNPRRQCAALLGALLSTAMISPASAETLSSNWDLTSSPNTGTVFSVQGADNYFFIITPLVTLSQVVNLAIGTYRLEYQGGPVSTASGFPTTVTPTISTADAPGDTLSTTAPSGGLADFLAVPTALNTDTFTITQSGPATLTFTFATEGCETFLTGFTFCGATFDYDEIVLTVLSLTPLAGLLPADAPQNALNVIAVIDPFAADAPNLPSDFTAIYALAPEDQVDGLLSLTGEVSTGVQQSRIEADAAFLQAMLSAAVPTPGQASPAPLSFVAGGGDAVPGLDRGWQFWGSATGGATRLEGDAATGASDLTARNLGLAVGGNFQLSETAVIGFGLGLTQSTFEVTGGSGEATLFHLGFNLRQEWEAGYLAAGLAATSGKTETTRLAGVSGDRLVADFIAPSVAARLEAGLHMALGSGRLSPFAAYQASAVFVPAYGETARGGDDALALDYDAQTVRTARAELGLRWSHVSQTATGTRNLAASLALAHNFNTDRTATAGFPALDGTSFDVTGASASENVVLFGLEGSFASANGWTTTGKLTGEVGDNSVGWGAMLRTEFRF